MKVITIAPCQWCLEAAHVFAFTSNGHAYYVQCNRCFARGPLMPDEERAVYSWNIGASARGDS